MSIFITAAQVLEATATNTNIPAAKIDPFIKVVDRELTRIIGQELYDRYDTAITADADLSDPENADLLALLTDHIRPFMAWRVKEHALPQLSAFLTVNGFQTAQGGDFIDKSSDAILKTQISGARSIADTYQEGLIDFLEDNGETFPEYATTGATEERTRTTYMGGIILRKSRYQYPYGQDDQGRERNQYDERINESNLL